MPWIRAIIVCVICLVVTEVRAQSCAQILALTGRNRPLTSHEINWRLVEKNTGHPTLILLHGLGSALQTFDPVIEELSQNYRVLTYDQRGHGKSSSRGDIYNTVQHAEDLKSLMNDLGIHSAHILGHSFGARIAIRFAALHPESVTSLTIEDSSPIAVDRALPKSIKQKSDALRQMHLEQKSFRDRHEVEAVLTPYLGKQDAKYIAQWKTRQTRIGTYRLLVRPDVYLRMGNTLENEDLSVPLTHVNAPILILRAGNHNTDIDRQTLRFFKHNISNASLQQIKTAGHNIHGSEPRKFMNFVDHFLSKLPRREAPR